MGRKKEKDSFLVFYDWEDCISDLSDEQVGRFFRAMFAYEKRGEAYTGNDLEIRMALKFVQGSLDRNREKYNRVCDRNQRNIEKRWNNTAGKNGVPQDTKDTSGKNGIPDDTKDTKHTDHDPDHEPDPDPDHEPDPDHDPDPEHDPDNAASAALGAAAAALAPRKEQPERAMAYYLDRFSAQISREAAELLPFYAEAMGDDVVMAAIDEAIDNKARSWGYIKAVLMAWMQAGVRNLASLERYRADRNKSGNGRGGKPAMTPQEQAHREAKKRQEWDEYRREAAHLLEQMKRDGGES